MQERQICLQYFPDPKERRKLPRQFIINVVNAVGGEPFWDFIHQKLTDINHKMLFDRNQ
jgi:hypothetical protein